MASHPYQYSSPCQNLSSYFDSVSSSKRGSEYGSSLKTDRECKRPKLGSYCSEERAPTDQRAPAQERGTSATPVSSSSSKQNVLLKPTKGNTELHLESAKGQLETSKCIVEGGAAVNATTETQDVMQQTFKISSLLRAVMEDKGIRTLTEILKQPGILVDERDVNGDTPLFWAVQHGNLDMSELLLENGADPSSATKEDWSALHEAQKCDNEKLIALLLKYLKQRQANADARDAYGKTVVFKAAAEGRKDTVKLLLKYNADVEACDDTGRTPLAAAAAAGHYEVVVLLREAGCSMDDWSKLLSPAAEGQHHEVVKFLLTEARKDCTEHRGSLMTTLEACQKALTEAARDGHLKTVECLINANIADTLYVHRGMNMDDALSETYGLALRAAAKGGQREVVERYAGRSTEEAKEHAVYEALRHGHTDVVKYFIDTKVIDVNVYYVKYPTTKLSCGGEDTPLHLAAKKGHADVVKVLVESAGEQVREAMLLMENEDGYTPLKLAGLKIQNEVVQFLSGTSPRERSNGETQLHEVSAKGDMVLFQLVANNMHTVDPIDQEGRTPLHYAAKAGKLETLIALLKRGADKEAKDKLGKRPLHLAAEGGIDNYLMIKELIDEWGVDVDAEDNEGKKALYYAGPWVLREMAKCS